MVFTITYGTVQLNGAIGENKWRPCGHQTSLCLLTLADSFN